MRGADGTIAEIREVAEPGFFARYKVRRPSANRNTIIGFVIVNRSCHLLCEIAAPLGMPAGMFFFEKIFMCFSSSVGLISRRCRGSFAAAMGAGISLS